MGRESCCPCRRQETQVRSLGREDPLEEGVTTTPVFSPGESRGQRSLVGYSPCGCRESDMTEATEQAHTHSIPSSRHRPTLRGIFPPPSPRWVTVMMTVQWDWSPRKEFWEKKIQLGRWSGCCLALVLQGQIGGQWFEGLEEPLKKKCYPGHREESWLYWGNSGERCSEAVSGGWRLVSRPYFSGTVSNCKS